MITKSEREKVMMFFLNSPNNTEPEISKRTGISLAKVKKIINGYLDEKMEKVNNKNKVG